MHRSGTSALSGALSNLGIAFDSEATRMQCGRINPNGYFERQNVTDFNDSLLHSIDWEWNIVPAVSNIDNWDAPKVVAARHMIDGMAGPGSIGIKDPRCCLLMPFWRQALLDRFEVVGITRDPAEVAWSLFVRDGISVSVGLALWIAYNAHLANGTQGLAPHFVRYEDLVQSPEAVLTSIADFLHGRGVELISTPTEIEMAAKSIDRTLRRDTFPKSLESHPLLLEARAHRELFHQHLSEDIVITPSALCVEILEHQFTAKRLTQVAHRAHFAESQMLEISRVKQAEIGQLQAELDLAIRTSQLEIDQLTAQHVHTEQTLLAHSEVITADLFETQQMLAATQTELDRTTAVLTATNKSFSLKLGLFLTWPIRHLRPSNRSR